MIGGTKLPITGDRETTVTTIPINSNQAFYELSDWLADASLLTDMRELIACQRRMAEASPNAFEPHPNPDEPTSPEALDAILQAGSDVHGIATDRSISNVISFNSTHDPAAVNSREVVDLRRSVDDAVSEKLAASFDAPYPLRVVCSGHFWYPPGGYMGWHTNSGAPGWRIYISHAREPGKSFFRYRDPESGQITTSWDHEWDVRVFRITPEAPLWHTVWSQTDRFSLGYCVYRKSMLGTIKGKAKQLIGR